MTLSKKVLLGVLAGLAISAIVVLIIRSRKPTPTGPVIISETGTMNTKRPLYYGNGVYYFPCHGKEFAASLSVFLSSDSTLKVKTVTSDTLVDGGDRGFIVTTGK